MKNVFPEKFFITGTDTGIGKTFISALLASGLNTSYWKPVQSGSIEGLDSDHVCRMSGLARDRIIPESYIFEAPLSPHLAADRQKKFIDPDRIIMPPAAGPLIIEGAGGVMVPLNNDYLMLNLIKKLGVPALIVAPNRLGVINHTLLTLTVLRSADIEIAGVILNCGISHDHKQSIEHFGRISVLAQVEQMEIINPQSMKQKFNELFF